MTCFVSSMNYTLTDHSSQSSVCKDSLSYCKIQKCESFNWMHDAPLPKLYRSGLQTVCGLLRTTYLPEIFFKVKALFCSCLQLLDKYKCLFHDVRMQNFSFQLIEQEKQLRTTRKEKKRNSRLEKQSDQNYNNKQQLFLRFL